MNAVYNRLLSNGGSGSASPSPPASPMRSPRLRHGRPPKGGRLAQQQPWGQMRALPQRIAWALLSLLLRRQAIFLFAPLIYISGMLLYMGTVSLDVVPRIIMRPPPGSVYRSPHLYQRLRHEMDSDNSSDHTVRRLGQSTPIALITLHFSRSTQFISLQPGAELCDLLGSELLYVWRLLGPMHPSFWQTRASGLPIRGCSSRFAKKGVKEIEETKGNIEKPEVDKGSPMTCLSSFSLSLSSSRNWVASGSTSSSTSVPQSMLYRKQKVDFHWRHSLVD